MKRAAFLRGSRLQRHELSKKGAAVNVATFLLGFLTAAALFSSRTPLNFLQKCSIVERVPLDVNTQKAIQEEEQNKEANTKKAATCTPITIIHPPSKVQQHSTYKWRGKDYNEDMLDFPRGHIPHLLKSEKMTTGAELGILVGDFARHTLGTWTDCTIYYAIGKNILIGITADLWAKQENYQDFANKDNDVQNANYQKTVENLKPWESKVKILRMKTVEAAAKIPDESLDYVYVDARHDYCGALEDIEAYWPKLRACGILAGHDYLDAKDPELLKTRQDWSLCMNGTVHNGAVKGAVRDFAASRGLTIYTTNDFPWRSWMLRKE